MYLSQPHWQRPNPPASICGGHCLLGSSAWIGWSASRLDIRLESHKSQNYASGYAKFRPDIHPWIEQHLPSSPKFRRLTGVDNGNQTRNGCKKSENMPLTSINYMPLCFLWKSLSPNPTWTRMSGAGRSAAASFRALSTQAMAKPPPEASPETPKLGVHPRLPATQQTAHVVHYIVISCL